MSLKNEVSLANARPPRRSGYLIRRGLGVALVALCGAASGALSQTAPQAQAILYSRIRVAADLEQFPASMVDDLIRLLSGGLDLVRPVQDGDSIALLLAPDSDGNLAKTELLAASLRVAGETTRYYRFRTPDDGRIGYYDVSGRSAAHVLRRKPLAVDTGILAFRFGPQRYRNLPYVFHAGVDWTAPRAAPIKAPGDGVVEIMDWNHSHGALLRLRHDGRYETTYSYLSAFAADLRQGASVSQGQVVGYVGSIGSSPPFLHYDVIVNGRAVDPLRIRLPRVRLLKDAELAAFGQERDRLDAMLEARPSHDLFRLN